MKLISKLLISFFTLFIIFNSCFPHVEAENSGKNGFLGKNKVSKDIYDKNTDGSLIFNADSFLTYLIGFLYFLAILYGVWGGFTIMTAAADEEKVKKGRIAIIQAIIGLIVIFLAGAIINLIINSFS